MGKYPTEHLSDMHSLTFRMGKGEEFVFEDLTDLSVTGI
jgi:hypothetical protein